MRVVVTIPCFDEEKRLDASQLDALLADPRIAILFVDDGSRDRTREVLSALVDRLVERLGKRASLLALPVNGGKAEAVRAGMRASLDAGADVVGYLDADFATPPDEMVRLVAELERTGAMVAMGSRVARLGAEIERKAVRHYLGRLFATTASMVLGIRVYDTQCGAKLFRDTPSLRHALATPFTSRWAFDVELLGRLLAGGDGAPGVPPERVLEMPLRRWRDVGGSKLRGSAMAKAGTDLLKLAAKVRTQGSRAFFL